MRTYFPECAHHAPRGLRSHGCTEAAICPDCRSVEWFQSGRPADPDVGMAALFGDFELVARLPALNAPGDEVLLYRPRRSAGGRSLEVFEPHAWFRVTPRLWLCHDGALLMLAPTDPLLARNLTRGGLDAGA